MEYIRPIKHGTFKYDNLIIIISEQPDLVLLGKNSCIFKMNSETRRSKRTGNSERRHSSVMWVVE